MQLEPLLEPHWSYHHGIRSRALPHPVDHRRSSPGAAPGTTLVRTLGLCQLTAIGLGAIIGAGIFALAGSVANGVAGPAVSIFGFMLGASRIWYAISRDGLLPRWFAETHPTRHVPHRTTWILGGVSALIAGVMPIEEAAELTSIGILLAFVVVCAAVIVLRYRRPDLPRTFRTPGMPIVPLIGIAFSLWLVTQLQPLTWFRFGVWFVLGLGIYALYGYRHSKLRDT